ncbi:MAG: response regulator transcription factor [Ignavibacteriae bacterium]|nr:response regulator transcription factor [Ignavibacteriota bacterium]
MKFDVVAHVPDGRTTIELVREHKPDIVIMDIGMPGLNGVEATRYIIQEFPSVKVIGLSMHTERTIIADMLRAGASAYLLKDAESTELAHAINIVLKNKKCISAEITDIVVDDYVHTLDEHQATNSHSLTPKEREVLQRLVEGYSAKEATEKMNIAISTFETHR